MKYWFIAGFCVNNEIIYYPNIQGVQSTKAIINYILKSGDYISKYKIDNLQIAQITIEKEIKEGQYITNIQLPKNILKHIQFIADNCSIGR
ncbi:12679_t:CDS:2 [Gigaspora margarita]|uniref:12679_t:CDS:1 n=1 Tax=Gigaspora margarita TaxID=4874 RepID=A0ABM8W1W6_GIGMA|nr:12679_t:CDS:2 [Gigaspora margarita]